MTVAELIAELGNFPPEMPVTVVYGEPSDRDDHAPVKDVRRVQINNLSAPYLLLEA